MVSLSAHLNYGIESPSSAQGVTLLCNWKKRILNKMLVKTLKTFKHQPLERVQQSKLTWVMPRRASAFLQTADCCEVKITPQQHLDCLTFYAFKFSRGEVLCTRSNKRERESYKYQSNLIISLKSLKQLYYFPFYIWDIWAS